MENVKLVLAAIFALAGAVDQADADGKIDLKDAPLLLGPALKMPAAFAAFNLAEQEWKNGSDADRQGVHQWAMDNHDIPEAKVEMKVKAAIDMVVAAGPLFT